MIEISGFKVSGSGFQIFVGDRFETCLYKIQSSKWYKKDSILDVSIKIIINDYPK